MCNFIQIKSRSDELFRNFLNTKEGIMMRKGETNGDSLFILESVLWFLEVKSSFNFRFSIIFILHHVFFLLSIVCVDASYNH